MRREDVRIMTGYLRPKVSRVVKYVKYLLILYQGNSYMK